MRGFPAQGIDMYINLYIINLHGVGVFINLYIINLHGFCGDDGKQD